MRVYGILAGFWQEAELERHHLRPSRLRNGDTCKGLSLCLYLLLRDQTGGNLDHGFREEGKEGETETERTLVQSNMY